MYFNLKTFQENTLILTLILLSFLIISACSKGHHASTEQLSKIKIDKEKKKFADAAQAYEELINTEKEKPDPNEAQVVSWSIEAGHNYLEAGLHEESIRVFQVALQIALDQNDKTEAAKIFRGIGDVYYRLENDDKALENFILALQFDQQASRNKDVVIDLNKIGLVFDSLAQYDKAIEYYQEGLEITRRSGNEEETAVLLNNIGEAYKSMGRFNTAIDFFQQTIKIDRRIGNLLEVTRNLNIIGKMFFSLGEYEKANEIFFQALEIDQQTNNKINIAIRTNNIGLVYFSWGRYDKAIEYYQDALTIARELNNPVGISTCLNNIGGVYSSWGNYEKALDYYNQALEEERTLDRPPGIIRNLNNIGSIYSYRGEYERALKYFQEGLQIAEKGNVEKYIAGELGNIGYLYKSQGEHEKAIEFYQQALKVDRKMGNKAEIALRLNNIGTVYGEWKQYDKAIEYFQKSLDIAISIGRKADVAAYLSNLGYIYDAKGNYQEAIQSYENSITIKEKLRKTATGDLRRDYLASQLYTYQLLASTFLKVEDPQGVLQTIEQSRAKSMAERILQGDSTVSLPQLEEIKQELNEDESILIYSNIDRENFILMVIAAHEVFITEISKEEYLSKVEGFYKDDIILMLDHQRGIQAPSSWDQDFKNKTSGRRRSEFTKSINYYRLLLTQSADTDERGLRITNQKNESKIDQNGLARSLYDLLIKPAEKLLERKNKLTIIPDGILGYLPFETLINSQGQFLVEKYDIAYSQSLTILKLLKERKYSETRKPMLAFGGAQYNEIELEAEKIKTPAELSYMAQKIPDSIGQNRSLRMYYEMLDLADWKNLPGTLNEVQSIADNVRDAEVITGADVEESNIKRLSNNGQLSNYRVIHFATHGITVPSLPELSALVLSQFQEEENGEDGYLRMGEIANFNLNADFVNLSACNTGLGKIYGGEGVVGLTQSFLIAGANGLSVSLWPVQDQSTSLFMSQIYSEVENKKLQYNEALSEVKRNFIQGKYGNKNRLPYYWAPFVYYGL